MLGNNFTIFVRARTSDKITNEPLQVVPADPVGKRKEAVAILPELPPGRDDLAKPFRSGRLFFDVRVGRTDSEDTLSSGYSIRASLMAVVEVDAEDFGDTIAKFVRHDG